MKKEETMMEITPCRGRGNSVFFSWCLFNCVWSPVLWPSSWLVWRFKREFVCISLISWFWRNTFLSASSSNSRFSGAFSLKKFVILYVVSCVSTFSINHWSFKTTLWVITFTEIKVFRLLDNVWSRLYLFFLKNLKGVPQSSQCCFITHCMHHQVYNKMCLIRKLFQHLLITPEFMASYWKRSVSYNSCCYPLKIFAELFSQ